MATDIYNCGIYSITAPSGNQYIGSSKNIKRRWNEHRLQLSNRCHINSHLQNAWNKYKDNLEFKILLVCESKDLLFYEQLLLDNFKPKYNISSIAGSPNTGRKASEETRRKQRLSHVGFKHTDEAKKKISDSHKTRIYNKPSEETRLKMSFAHKGKPQHPNVVASHLGRKNSPETLEKMRQAALNRFKREDLPCPQ